MGRGGRIIFDRALVRDRTDDPRYGVEVLDWNVTDKQSMELWKGDSICAKILRQRQDDSPYLEDVEDDIDMPLACAASEAGLS